MPAKQNEVSASGDIRTNSHIVGAASCEIHMDGHKGGQGIIMKPRQPRGLEPALDLPFHILQPLVLRDTVIYARKAGRRTVVSLQSPPTH